MAKASLHRPVGSFLTRSRPSVRPALEALEARLAPAGFVVDRSSDLVNDGSGFNGSLRYCLNQANTKAGFDTISIATTQPIVLSSQLQITDTVAIVGASGLPSIERTNGESLFGLFDITSKAGNVTLANLELTGGHAQSTGGAISNVANLTLQNCWIHDNAADGTGGGVYTTGKLTVADCTFQANSVAPGGTGGGGVFIDSVNATFTGTTFEGNSADSGGGVYIQAFAANPQVDFRDCTFSGNQATAGDGGALATYGGEAPITATFLDCTLADNTSSSVGGVGGVFAHSAGGKTTFIYQGTLFADNSGASLGGEGTLGFDYFLTSQGHNLSTDGVGMTQKTDLITSDPGLGTLGFYGGPTPTIPLLAGSPAIDAGTLSAGTTDQRGVSRPQGSAPDIGAFEVRPRSLVLASNGQFANVGVAFSRGGSITDGDGSATAYVDYGDPADPDDDDGPSPLGSGPNFTLSHAYSAEGSYTVTVTLFDNTTGVLLDAKQFRVDVFLAGVDTTQIHQQTTSGPGVVTVQATEPDDGSSVTATLSHLSNTNASLLVAIVPASIASGLNGSPQIAGNTITSAFDVRAVNVGIGDDITVVFHYFNDDFDQPVLRYFNRATGQQGTVSTDTFIVDPVTKTIAIVLEAGSIPGILDINGTVFTIAVPLAVSVSPTPDAITVSSLQRGGGGNGGFGLGGGGEGGSGAASSASFQVTGRQTFYLISSLTALAGPLTDDSSGGRSFAPDRANLLADLPVVPDSLITLPGPILTPGSAETPVPNEPPKVSTPPEGDAPATSRLDDPEDDVLDEVFVRFDGGLALECCLLHPWIVEDEGDILPAPLVPAFRGEGHGGDAPTDWHDAPLAIAVFVAARPAAPRRRSGTNAPDER